MLDPGILRREQREDEVDRLPVDRIEIERLLEPQEHADHRLQTVQTRMRQRHAMPHAGGAERLAFLQRVDGLDRIQPVG